MRNPLKLLTDSFTLIRENLLLFIGIVILPMLVSYLAGLLMPAQNTGVVRMDEWVVYIVLMLISAITSVLMSIALIIALDNRSLTVMQVYKASLPFFLRYILLSILTSIILLVAFLLFVIPGIILSVWFAFATFILVLENAPIIDSLKRSREYVRGHWWGVFGRLIVMTVIAFGFSIGFALAASFIPHVAIRELAVTLLSVVLVPILVGYTYLLYKDLKNSNINSAPSQTDNAVATPVNQKV